MIRRLSIKRKIIGIALILIALMTVTALISLALVMQVSGRLEELTQSYVPAYAALARANVHSLERAVALRRMMIEKIQSPPDEARYAAARKRFEESGGTFDREAKAARSLLDALIAKGSSFGDAPALVRIDTRLADVTDGTRVQLNEEITRLLPLLDGGDQKAIAESLQRVDELRDNLNRELDTVRGEMVALVRSDSAATLRRQQTVVMGETVNLASRLEGANKIYGGRILTTEATVTAAGDALEVREIDRVALVGQSRAQPVYEIMGRSGALTPNQIELRARYAAGLAAYRNRRWEEAREAFTAALAAMPDDGPTLAMLKRVDTLAGAPPAENWDGAWHLDQK